MRNEYIAVIQAGGKGTRMLELTHDELPKPMIQLNGKPMIQWQIENIAKYGIREFVIIIGHLGEKIKEYFGDGTIFGIHISYIEEKEPLGSAGALYFLRDDMVKQTMLFIFGDVMFDLAWDKLFDFHEKKGGLITVLAHPNSHPYDSDLLIVDENAKVVGLDSKNKVRDYWYENCVNAGIYVIESDILKSVTEVKKMDLEKDILVPLMQQGGVYAYLTSEYVKDAGTPERFQIVCKEQRNGIWEQKSLNKKQRCIFLDRDGTINKFRGLVSEDNEFELEEGVAKAIREINMSGYLAIVITNQPVVARGMCEIADVDKIHRKMQTLLGEQKAYVDDIVFCPHHPDKGYPEENPIYKITCDCRKPATGMIDRMVKKYNIDLSKSFMIGDSTIDIQTGINAGVKTILVLTGQAGSDGKYDVQPDQVAENLLDAVESILHIEKEE